jgi:hypothetical protein
VGAALALFAPALAAQDGALLAPLDAAAPIGYFIDAESGAAGFRSGDGELCAWALADWARNAAGRIAFEPAAEDEALIRVRFVSAQFGQYGEMRPIRVGGRRGAEVFIRPDTDSLGPEIAAAARADPLMREAVVYLTCLHELGHALGLEHTAVFADVMYFFGYGGDIAAFFGRYRGRLAMRADIAGVSGLSSGDVAQLQVLYPSE